MIQKIQIFKNLKNLLQKLKYKDIYCIISIHVILFYLQIVLTNNKLLSYEYQINLTDSGLNKARWGYSGCHKCVGNQWHSWQPRYCRPIGPISTP